MARLLSRHTRRTRADGERETDEQPRGSHRGRCAARSVFAARSAPDPDEGVAIALRQVLGTATRSGHRGVPAHGTLPRVPSVRVSLCRHHDHHDGIHCPQRRGLGTPSDVASPSSSAGARATIRRVDAHRPSGPPTYPFRERETYGERPPPSSFSRPNALAAATYPRAPRSGSPLHCAHALCPVSKNSRARAVSGTKVNVVSAASGWSSRTLPGRTRRECVAAATTRRSPRLGVES